MGLSFVDVGGSLVLLLLCVADSFFFCCCFLFGHCFTGHRFSSRMKRGNQKSLKLRASKNKEEFLRLLLFLRISGNVLS